jgi:hypothetical protein
MKEDMEEDIREDKCKCGKTLYWRPEEMTHKDRVTCHACETVYRMDCDSILVYWLEEVIPSYKLTTYKTDPR